MGYSWTEWFVKSTAVIACFELKPPRIWENNSLVIDMFGSSSDLCSSD